jgi:hypothetical protein
MLCSRQPPAQTKAIEARDLEATPTTYHVNACVKPCTAGSHCGYCSFSDRYSIKCCKKDTSSVQIEEVDTPTPEAPFNEHRLPAYSNMLI